MSYQHFITETLNTSADIARSYFGDVSSSTKPTDNNQVLTEADIKIGNHIIERLRHDFPEHNIIDEEAGVVDNGSDYTWVIDPIDGTSNFAAGSELYGILLGLLHKGQPIAGGVSLPSLGKLFIAEKGKGAFEGKQRMQVSKEQQLLNTLVAYQIDGHQEAPEKTHEESKVLADLILSIRNLRTQNCVYDQMMVATGVYGGCINKTSKVWDNVAVHIIIEEAGGVYTDYFGKLIDYSDAVVSPEKNYTYLAASPVLHTQIQQVLT